MEDCNSCPWRNPRPVSGSTEQDIMYWFGLGGDIPGFFRRYRERLDNRDDIPRHSGLSDRDVARLRVQYSEK